MKNCFLNTRGVNIGGRRIKCIRFSDNMALLAEDERMPMELNDSYDDYGMKININETKAMVIERKPKKIDMQIKNEFVEQVDSFKYRVIQILRAHTHGCRSRPWLARLPVIGSSY